MTDRESRTMPTRSRSALLAALATILGSTISGGVSQAQPHGHRSSTGSHNRHTGPRAKRAEKARRQSARNGRDGR